MAPAATGNDSGSHRYWLRQLLKKDLQYKVKTICCRWNVTFHHNQLFNSSIQHRWQVKAMVKILSVGMKKQRYEYRNNWTCFSDVDALKGLTVNNPRWNRGIRNSAGRYVPERGEQYSRVDPFQGSPDKIRFKSPGFTGGYSQLVPPGHRQRHKNIYI